jgi:hypothetical protein
MDWLFWEVDLPEDGMTLKSNMIKSSGLWRKGSLSLIVLDM